MDGPCCAFIEERPGRLGSLPPSDPKLGRVTTVLPPRTSTPGTAGEPVGALPAPPGPGVGEMPPREFRSAAWPVPGLPAPAPSPDKLLPGPSPRTRPLPRPEPPSPGWSPPGGDMASDPWEPLPGTPKLEPGWAEITTPEVSRFPPAPLGGASDELASPEEPRPMPFLPKPGRPDSEPIDGGGGMTLPGSEIGRAH